MSREKYNFFMEFYQRLQMLAKEEGLSLNELEEELGYSKNTLYHYKSKQPTAQKLIEIAGYFDVSIDFLLGKSNHRTISRDLEDNKKIIERLKKGKNVFELDEAIADWFYYLKNEDRAKVLEYMNELILKDLPRIEAMYSLDGGKKLRKKELENLKKIKPKKRQHMHCLIERNSISDLAIEKDFYDVKESVGM